MSHPISSRVLATVVFVVATLGLVGPAAAAAWSVSAATNQFGSGREDFRYTLNPGGTLDDAVEVTNSGTAPLQVALHPTDGLAWVKLQRDTLTVAAGDSAEVPFA